MPYNFVKGCKIPNDIEITESKAKYAALEDVILKLNNTLEFCKENQRYCNEEFANEIDDYENPWDEDIKGIEGALKYLNEMKGEIEC